MIGLTPNLAQGATVTLANLQGPGTVDLIQIGVGPIFPPGPIDKGNRVMLDSLLRIRMDGAPPLITDLGTFFVAHGESDPWACDRLGVTGMDHVNWSGASYFHRLMIPFNTSCVIELVNGSSISSAAVFSQVYYYEGPTPTSLSGTRRNRFAWQWTPFTKVAPYRTLNLLNTKGKGTMDGIQLFTAGTITPGYTGDPNRFPPCWLEGNPAFTIDGGLGDWHTGGAEDFFGTQGYGMGLHQTTDSWGMPTRKPISDDQFAVTMYRFFDRDPVIFDQSCTFTICNGQQGQGDGAQPPDLTVAALVSYYLA